MKISEITEFLENAFDILNEKYFNGELPKVCITVQSGKHCYAWYTTQNMWSDSQSAYREINMSAEYLDLPIERKIASLLHEMCHHYCDLKGIKDCSRGNRGGGSAYHNKRFKEQAEQRGLIIEYDKRIGYSITSPSEELIAFVNEMGWSDIDLSRKSEDLLSFGGSSGRTTKPSSTRKYICPCCHNSVRATKFVNIACLDCDEIMIIEEK